MWMRAKQISASLALALALFICVWVSRIFFAGEIVRSLTPLTGPAAVAWIAVVGGLLPALPMGLAYGLMRTRRVLSGAIVVAVIAGVLELAIASTAVAWWKFVTWWVLPLEGVTVLVFFVLAALVGSRLLQRLSPRARFRLGLSVFVLLTIGAMTWPWLYSCILLNACALVA